MEKEGAFKLSQMLKQLRKDLEDAQESGRDSPLGLKLGPIELELEVVVGSDKEGGVEGGWWVLSAKASASWNNANTQKLKLTLQPINRKTGDPLEVSGQGAAPPTPDDEGKTPGD